MKAPLVLIAEDDPDQSEQARNVLTDAGYRVQVLHRGNEVLPQAELLKPNLLIMDVRMPGLNGMQVLKSLRQSAKFSTLAVILISAYYSAGELERMMKIGANACLSKPFEMKELLSEVQRLVGIVDSTGNE